MSQVAIQEIGMEFDSGMRLYLPEANPAPIGALDAMDQPDPLALDAREQAIVDSWKASEAEKVVTSYGSVEEIVSAETAEELKIATGMKEDEGSGLILPVDEVKEAENESGFFAGLKNKATSLIKEHPRLAKATAVAGAITALAAAAPDTAQGASWTKLGGDPLVTGGVPTRADFVDMMTSHKGKTAMAYAGLNNKEIQALVLGAREGDEYDCDMPYGEKFKAMSFGIHGTSVDRNVRFKDPDYKGNPADAWCMDERVDLNGDGKFDETVHIKVPKICGNFGLVNITPIHHPKHHPKKIVPVFFAKQAITETGDLMDPAPSDTFQATLKCRRYGKMITKNVIINMGPHGEPVFVAKCNQGTNLKAWEGPTIGPDRWINLNNVVQRQTARRHGNLFTWKDKEVSESTCEATQPAVNCLPKDGTQGPGAGTPGQPGGPGAGGDPSPSPNTVACYDPATTTDGDMNPATEGATMWGTAADQNDYCIGQASPAV